jgi:hypothetical protein
LCGRLSNACGTDQGDSNSRVFPVLCSYRVSYIW